MASLHTTLGSVRPLTNEYQVLQVTMSLYKDMIADSLARVVTSFNIFKLGTGLWRGIEVDSSDLPLLISTSVSSVGLVFAYIYGAIHWMHGTQDLKVAFDLKDERFRIERKGKDEEAKSLADPMSMYFLKLKRRKLISSAVPSSMKSEPINKQWYQSGMEEAFFLCHSLKCLKTLGGEDNFDPKG
ncbi:hypothetical protein M0R45_016908 [Rubus argutus]|uniref:Uncharacterized protein n=1 Tax=Rubus argutus TaxID=59490 RepID=A0AAW1XU08_RUBAR